VPVARLWFSRRSLRSSSEATIPEMYSSEDEHISKDDGSQSGGN